ncbi:TPA: hypothetical protein RQL08_001776 [Vibrio vulnificus]|nr:hypothetical protein [Vibrio vulnificus]HDY8148109.1 hypothetical protein [Vibrio vulnificus]
MDFIFNRSIVCPNQTVRFNPTNTSPTNWIRSDSGITVISIQGYTVSTNNDVTGIFLRAEYIGEENVNVINRRIIETYFKNPKWDLLIHISKVLSCPINLVLCPINHPYNKSTHNERKIFYYAQLDEKNLEPKMINIDELEEIFACFRMRRFRNVKPLKSASSCLECYLANDSLSHEKSPWPGDIDGIIFTKNAPKAIIEYKTHNLKTPISQEYVGKYGKEDWRRFNVLYTLMRKLNIPIFFIVWGPNHDEVKIQIIKEENAIDSVIMTNKNDFSNALISILN